MKFTFKSPEQVSIGNDYTIEMRVFSAQDGYIEHYINGKLRATVAIEHWGDYCRSVPAADKAQLVEVVESVAVNTAENSIDMT